MTNTAAGVVATTPLAPLAPVVQNLNVVPANYDPVAPLVALVGGQVGPLTAVNQLLCPPLTKVAQLVASLGQPAIASGITTIACSTGILEYKFVTHFKKPDGTLLEKTFSATFGVPTLLDVTGDGVPDFIGTLTLTGTNSIGLTIDRMPTYTGASASEIEAVVSDPGGLLLGNRALRFGFDSTMDNAPQEFVISTPLNTLLAPSANFTASISQKTPGAKVALVAGTFQGTYDARVNPIDLSLLYGNSPTAASISATIGDHDIITLSQNTIGQLTANGHIVNGTEVQDFNAVITNIAAYLSLDIATGNTISANYTSSARVATIRATLLRTHVVGSTATILQKAILNLDDVPIGIQLALANGTNNGTITTTGGPIGLTKIGLANGEPKFLTDAAYADVDNDGTIQSVSAQIPGLENATFSLTPTISLAATLTATPFRVRVAQPGRVLDAHVNNIPHKINIAFDPTALTLDYSGFDTSNNPAGIGQITVAGDSTPVGSNPALAFFGRATKIRANILGIPAVLHAALTTNAGGGSITASAPINSIEVLASNGPETYPTGTGQGVIYHDVPNGEYLISARVLTFRSLTFDTSNGAAITANTAGGPFTLDFLNATLQATGLIQDLPAQTSLNYNRSANTLTFQGKKADNTPVGINTLTLDAQAVTGTLLGAATRLNAVITGIPATETLALQTGTNHFGVTANPAIPKIEIVAANRVINRTADLPNTSGMGLKYIDQGGVFLVSARVLGLAAITADTGTPISLFAQTSGGPFRADIATGNITADATLADLPAKTTLTADLNAGQLTFKGRNADDTPAGINTIDVNASSTTALFGRATNLKAHITGVPSDLTLNFTQAGGGVNITASNPIGLVEIGAANRALSFPADLPAGSNQGVNYTDTTANYVIAARVLQISKLAATVTDPISIETITAGGPFLVNATTNTLTAHAAVLNLPAHLLATLSLAQGKLTVNGFGQGIAQITADAHSTTPLFGRATDVNLNVQGIPSSLTVDLTQTGNGVDVTADNPIALIEVAAANSALTPSAVAAALPAAGEQGVNYTDLTGGTYLIGARVKQLTELGATLSDPITITAKTAGGPFQIHAITDGLTANARIMDLPSNLSASLSLAGGHLQIDGHGQGIAQITADAHSSSPLFGRATDINLNVQGIPASLDVDLTQSGNGVDITASNPITLIEVAAANSALTPAAVAAALPAAGEQGVNYTDLTGGTYLIGARVKQLTELGATLSDPITITAKTAGGPFQIHAITSALTANARVTDLPSNLFAKLSIAQGILQVDGHGQGIAQITADAHSTTPLFGRATDLNVNVQGIPDEVTLNLAQSGSGVSINADNPIALIEIVAANRAPNLALDLPLAGEQGVNFVDQTGGDYLIGARITQLKQLGASFASNLITLDAQTGGGPFGVHALTDTLSADARVENLPHQLHAALNLSGGTLDLTGQDAGGAPEGIGRLTADVVSSTALFGRAKYVHANVLSIPSTLHVDFSQNGDGVGVSANAPIGLIEVVAASRPVNLATDLPPANVLPVLPEQGIRYTDVTGGDFVLGARVRQLTTARINTTDPIKLTVDTEGGPFSAVVDTDTLDAQARIDDLPSHLAATLDLANSKIVVADSGPIGSIHLAAQSTTPLFGAAKNVQADILGVPANLNIDFAQSATDGIGLTADSAISSIELAASSDPIAADYGTDLPAGTQQGIRYIDKAGTFTIGARVRDLKVARVNTGTPITLHLVTQGGSFSAFIDTDALTATAEIDDLPADLTLSADLTAGNIGVIGRDSSGNPAGIDHLTLDASSATALFLRADHVHADIHGIGSDLNLNLAQAAGGVNLTASQPIASLEIVARQGAIANPDDYLPASNEQGATFDDKTGGEFLIAARVRQLKSLSAVLNGAFQIGAETEGGPFTLHAETDDLTGDVRIEDLPAKLTASVDLDSGQLSIDSRDAGGNLQPINKITLNLSSATEVFGGAKNVAANIEGIPGNFLLDLAQDASGLTLDTHGNPIDLLEIAAQDAPITDLNSLLPSGTDPDDQGATFHDGSSSPFLLAARIRKLNVIHVSLDDAVTHGISFNAKTEGGHFALDVQAAGLTSTGFFEKLPADVTLGLDQSSGELSFDGKDASGNPQGVSELNLGVVSTDPFFSGARKLSLDIHDLSPHIAFNLANSGTGGSITADCGAGAPDPNACPITSIELLASSDPAATFPTTIATGEQGVILHQDTPAVGDFLLAARLLDLRSLTFGLSGTNIGLDANLRSTPFSVDIDAQGLNATANIVNLPQRTNLGFDLDSGHFTFDGKDEAGNPVGIDSITFGADAPADAPLFGAATKLRGSILMVPPHMDIGFDQTDGVVDLSTTGGAIGTLDFLASNDPNANFRTGQGITFRDVTDDNGTPTDLSDDTRDFNLSAKVLGLQTLQAGIAGLNGDDPNTPQVESGAISLVAVTAGGLFDLDIASNTFSATGTIDQLPPNANIDADLGAGAITFDGHGQGITHLQLDATAQADSPIFGRANHLSVNIHGLPQHVTVGISQPNSTDPNATAGTGASIEATDPAHPLETDPLHFLTITQVEISAWNDTAGQQLPIGTDQGIIYRDVDTDSGPDTVGPFAIGARINNLKKLSADFGDALNLSTITAGGPFHANIQTQSFSDDPTPVESGLSADVDILNLPASFNLQANLGSDAVTLPDTTVLAPGSIAYTAKDGLGNPTTIGELKAEIGSVTPLISDANHFNIDLQSLPSSATIGVAPDSGALTLSAGGGSIGQVDIKARDDGSPTYPGQAGGDPNADSAFLDGTGGHFLLNARIFNLQTIAVTLSPINLHAQVGGISRPFHADIKLAPSADALAANPAAPNTHATLDVLNLPSTLDVGIVDIPTTIVDPAHPDPTDPAHFKSGGTQITYNAIAPISELKIHADGISLLAGASSIDADLNGVPKIFAMQLPDTTVLTTAPLASLLIADRVAHPTNPITSTDQIDEMRIAAGSKTLTDVPHTTGNDKFLYDGTTTNFGVGVRLTGVKALSMNLDPVNLSIDQNVATTKIIDLNATLPQDTPVTIPPTPPLPNSTVTGTLNKPTGHTELGVTLTPGAPTQLTLKNGDPSLAVSPGNANQTMTSLTLNLANLGAIPAATFSLSHIPKVMLACLATDSSCIRTDTAHATPVFPTWTGPNPCTASPQNPLTQGTGTPKNRPYQPLVSMYFDDTGTSTQAGGPNSAANRSTANMTTMNANITLSATQPHVIVNTLRFHQLSLDLGQQALVNPTSNPPDNTFTYKPIVSISAGQVPRLYMYLDSQKLPFVMTDVEYPPQLPKMVMGTDASPARALDRIAWVPGAVRSSILGCSIGQNISTQSFNSLDCGGAKELDLSTSLGNLNAFNLPIFGDVLNICGGTVPTT